MKHVHEWVVYSTAILGRCLLLQCVECGALATVDDPTTREWSEAFRAPSRPYRWADEARVHVQCQPPCPFFVIRVEEGGPSCPCPPRPGAQGRREYERFPGEILGDKYIDGELLAQALGFTLETRRPDWPKPKGPDKKLQTLR